MSHTTGQGLFTKATKFTKITKVFELFVCLVGFVMMPSGVSVV